MRPLLVTFVGGASGPWRVQRTEPVVGESLPMTERMSMLEGEGARPPADAGWVLRGVTSNHRYTNEAERDARTITPPTMTPMAGWRTSSAWRTPRCFSAARR